MIILLFAKEFMTDTAVSSSSKGTQASSVKLELGTIFDQAWKTFKASWLHIYAAMLIMVVSSIILQNLTKVATDNESSIAVAVVTIVSMLLSYFWQIGQMRLFIGKIRDASAPLSLIWSGTDVFVKFVFAALRYALIVFGGMLLLIIPGIYLSLKYMFVLYLVADRNMNISDAFKASAMMTDGVKWQIMGIGFLAGCFGLAGIILLGVGLLVTIPVAMLTSYVMYNTLLGRLDGTEFAK